MDAIQELNGRWFAERRISARMIPLEDYNSRFLL